MADAIRVLIADDQALPRGSFRLLINSTPGMEAIGEASDGASAVELARELKPHVVLMDLRMPVMDGITVTRQICSDEKWRGCGCRRSPCSTWTSTSTRPFRQVRADSC